jgi:hypothetical protein
LSTMKNMEAQREHEECYCWCKLPYDRIGRKRRLFLILKSRRGYFEATGRKI